MRKKTGYIQPRGDSFRIAWYDINGVRQFETHPTLEDAQRELAQRIADTTKGIPVTSKPSTVLFEELAADVVIDYQVNKRASIEDLKARFRIHICPVFGTRKATQITTTQLKHYIIQRQAEGASTGTINRELEAIRHTFLMARKEGKLMHSPHVPHLEEDNARQGFFTREQVDRLCSHLKAPIDSFVTFAFLTGWRYGEIQNLKWSNVDFAAGEVRLNRGETKTGEPRVMPMNEELRALLEGRRRPATTKRKTTAGRIVEKPAVLAISANSFVFGSNGKAVGAFRKSWKTACHKAGLPCTVVPVKKGGKKGAVKVLKTAMLFHDLRRSAAREFQRQGFTEGQIMRMCGWETRSVFDRYAIVTDADIREKMEALDGTKNGAKADSAKA